MVISYPVPAFAEDFARRNGLTFEIGPGLENVPHVDRGGVPLFPGYHPGAHDDAVWVVAYDGLTPAARSIGIPLALLGTLTEHLETEGLFPSSVDLFVPIDGARRFCDRITGLIAFEGDLIVAPAFRKKAYAPELFGVLLDVIRDFAASAWACDTFHLFKRGHPSAKRFGATEVHETVVWVQGGSLKDGKPRDLGYVARSGS